MTVPAPTSAPRDAVSAAGGSPAPATRPTVEQVMLDLGLTAQRRMLPYAAGFFGIGLPIFLWSASLSLPAWLIVIYAVVMTANWGAMLVFRIQIDRLMRQADDASADKAIVQARLWRQGLTGLMWALSLLVISWTSVIGGGDSEMLLMICAGAAVGIIFFSSPVLLYLLILGPLAVAGPALALQNLPHSTDLSRVMSGGLALALALGIILNRHMQQHYRLQHRQDELAREREVSRAASDALIEGRIALMETLSREVQTGLKGASNHLIQSLTHLARAPAPRQHIDVALSEIAHLQTILITTLDNDTAAAGQIEIEKTPLDVERLGEKVMAQFAVQAQAKDLTFTLAPPHLSENGAAIGDAYRVEQILAHLVGNAVQYTQTGRVELKMMMTADGFARLEVVDSGPGLDDDELEQAFVAHARIQRTSSGHSGAGLGLSLSKSLSRLMDGRIGAQSTPDVGSKFWLDLPFDPAATMPARPAEPEITADETRAQALRVLLLSNDSLRAAQLRDQLEHLGHKCLTTTTRARALSLAQKAPIDACLISTGAFENLSDDGNRRSLDQFLATLRASQTEAHLNILALLPQGDQVEDLQALGIRTLLLPQNRESLGRALAQA